MNDPEASHDRVIRLGLVTTRTAERVELALRDAAGHRWRDLRACLEAKGVQVPAALYRGEDPIHQDSIIGSWTLRHHSTLVDRRSPPEAGALLYLEVAEGPATGLLAPVRPGRVTVGRHSGCDIPLADTDVSRLHAVVRLDQGRLTVEDLGSTNGTIVDGQRLPPYTARVIGSATRIRVGSCTLRVRRAHSAVTPAETTADGRVPVHRAPHARRTQPTVTLTAPTSAGAGLRRQFPWLMAGLPLVAAAAMVLLLHSMAYAIFAVLSPLMLIGQHLTERRRAPGPAAEHPTQTRAEFEDRLQRALRGSLEHARAEHPMPVDLAGCALTRSRGLWRRAPEDAGFLDWRLGIGTAPSGVTVRQGDRSEQLMLHDAPVVVNLRAHRRVAVHASRPVLDDVAGGLILQLATLHSPRDLRVQLWCATSRVARWDPLLTLPHLEDPVDAAPALWRTDTDSGHPPWDGPATVVLVDDPAVLRRPEIAALLVDPPPDVAFVVLASRPDDVPSDCTLVLDATASRIRVTGAVTTQAIPDLPTGAMVGHALRALACCIDPIPRAEQGALPRAVGLADVARAADGLDPFDPGSVQTAWEHDTGSPTAVLGVTASGPLTLDLAAEGPHALIAGTTGAGKSELLQTLLCALATRHRPDQLVFVLVDYKGGSAFTECEQLPHTVGVVTDLDQHLTQRALTCLDAELKRRERLLRGAGARDLADYRARPGEPPIPRLLLVIDEFRVLAEELPDFVAGLVRVATVGRSLGIHLVLATQRPAGIVSPDIRANVNLRIALRMRDEQDSRDVIDDPRAARIGADRPGRAVLRTGGGDPVEFQTARATGHSTAGRPPIGVGTVDPATAAVTWAPDRQDDDGPSDLTRMVSSCRRAAARMGISTPPSPWPDPLPDRLEPGTMPECHRAITAASEHAWPFAMLDLPDRQARLTLGWEPGVDGNLAVIGGPRSGRSTTLRTLAGAATEAEGPARLHLYVVDFGTTLHRLSAIPHCAGMIGPDDLGLLRKLVDWLSQEIRRRRMQVVRTEPAPRMPRIVLMIDSWDALADACDEAGGAGLMDDLARILRDGPAVRVSAAATGGRALSSGRATALFPSRIVLPVSDDTDLILMGLSGSRIPEHRPPGRGIVLPDAEILQVSLPPEPAAPDEAPRSRDDTAVRFDPLPREVAAADLGRVTEGRLAVGLAGDVPVPAGLPVPVHGLIAGPPRSGRSTALRTAAGRWAGPVAQIGAPTPGENVTSLGLGTPDEPATWCRDHPGGLLLVDDVERLVGSPAEQQLLDAAAILRQNGGSLLVAGSTADLLATYRGLIPAIRRHQCGILLQPARHDGELLGVRVPLLDRTRPGHGLLVHRGATQEIQVARASWATGSARTQTTALDKEEWLCERSAIPGRNHRAGRSRRPSFCPRSRRGAVQRSTVEGWIHR